MEGQRQIIAAWLEIVHMHYGAELLKMDWAGY
jgi:hypothetical protein